MSGATLFTLLELPAMGQVGLDPGFNTGTGAEDDVQTVAIQNDGKIIVAGLFYNINGTTNSLAIARLATNGTVDASFNPGSSVDYGINSVAVQTNGKIIIGGGFTMYQGVSRVGIAGLTTNGALDTTFNPGTGVNDQIASVVLQTDGKVLIGGYFTTYNGTTRSGLARVNANGTLDSSFNPGSGVNYAVWSMGLTGNGKIILGGGFTLYNAVSRIGVARINADGSLDTTFNPGASVDNLVRVAVPLPDGRVIIGGDFTTFNGVSRNHIACLNTNGSLDTTFNPGAGTDGSVYAVTVQPNGKVIVAGNFTMMGGVPRSNIARLLPNGALDTSFGVGTDNSILTMALQTNGEVVLGGQFVSVNAASNIRLARLLISDAPVPPIITSLTSIGTNTTLTWNSSANQIYRVDYTPTLYPTNWNSFIPYITSAGNNSSFTNNTSGINQRYYRVALLPF